MLEDEESDAWPDEPDEFDPDSLGPDPPQLSTDESDVPDDVFRAFWGTVVFANVALFGISLGLMLVYFRGDWKFGGAALAVGTFAAFSGARLYYRHRRDRGGD